jgi:hypothetical protein
MNKFKVAVTSRRGEADEIKGETKRRGYWQYFIS